MIFSGKVSEIVLKKVHRIAYPIAAKTDKEKADVLSGDESGHHSRARSKLHWLRDGDAGAFYANRLGACGYSFGLELNLRGTGDDPERAVSAEGRLKKGDLLLLNTRPPLSPDDNHLLARIPKSESWIENQVLGGLGKVFQKCSRDEVALHPELAAFLSHENSARARMKFKTRAEAEYSHGAAIRGEYTELHTHRTGGYLIHMKELWPNGPDLMCSFAMSGPMNLAWAYLLAARHPDLLVPGDKERFFWADIVPDDHRPVFPPQPDALDFLDRWRLDPVLHRTAPNLWLESEEPGAV